jgi:hypothetical protein
MRLTIAVCDPQPSSDIGFGEPPFYCGQRSCRAETRTNHGAAPHGRGQDLEMVGGTEFLGFGSSHLFFFFCMAKCCPYRRRCALVLASDKTR